MGEVCADDVEPPRRHLRSFSAFARRKGWLADDPAGMLERRNEPADRTKAIAASSPERLFHRQDVALREKCLWRLLYETAARAEEVRSSDVADLDVENKRLRVVRKGGDTDWLFFQSAAARLLPKLLGDRDAGPVFLAERRPAPARAPASVDLCPVTGRGRLSYERAEYLFKQNSLKVAKQGWTLHQLRHSALTHLAEAGVNLPLLTAKSGHQSLRSLQRYTELALTVDLIRLEDLRVKQMTKSAKGTVQKPGRNVRQKAGLNRGILSKSWSMFARRLEDKAPGRVELVPASYTSQECPECHHVDKENRKSQAVFACARCGLVANADLVGAINTARRTPGGSARSPRGTRGVETRIQPAA